MGMKIGIVVDGLGINEWIDANVLAGKWYAQAHDMDLDIAAPEHIDPGEQMAVIREVVDHGPDALVVQPIQGEAVEPALLYAKEKGIPVITEDMLVRTDTPVIDIRFEGFDAGAETGTAMLALLDDLNGGKIDEGAIVVVVSHKNPHQLQRAKGFMSAIEPRTGIEMVECDITPCAEMTDNAREAVTRILRDSSGKRMIGCFGYGNLVTIGIARAIADEGLLRTRTDKDHIAVGGIDACPQTISLMKNGEVDILVDQPCSFYLPIALYYAQRYLQDGEDAIPAAGSTVTAGDIMIEGADPHGVDPWKVQTWSPAEVKDAFGHRWFKTNSVTVTPENCESDWLWGNFIRKVR